MGAHQIALPHLGVSRDARVGWIGDGDDLGQRSELSLWACDFEQRGLDYSELSWRRAVSERQGAPTGGLVDVEHNS